MFDDVDFNHFDRADYTIFGTMSAAQIDRYQEILHGALPEPMIKLMSLKSSLFTYVRRGLDNVTFDRELHLDGLYEKDKKDRASMRRWRIKLMSLKSSLFTYVRRGLDNVTFDRELHLDGLYEKDKKDRASMRRWRSRNR